MKKILILLAAAACISPVVAQPRPPQGGPPQGDSEQGQDGQSQRGQRPPPPPAIIGAIDADRDGVISADEINNASEALKQLDQNGDGQLTREEFGPPPPRQGQGSNRRNSGSQQDDSQQ